MGTAKTNTPLSPAAKGVDLLATWGNKQEHWLRGLVAQVLATRQPLSEADLDASFKNFCAEKKLTQDPLVPVASLSVSAGHTGAAATLRIDGIKNVRGVNVLAGNQEIAFNPRLTVFFGENASGKSGYVRILKRASLCRSAESILSDIRGAAPQVPRATLRYSLDGQNQPDVEWNNEAGLSPFNRIAVFDSRAVSVHLDEDLTYSFVPADVALFPYVHAAIEGVRTRLERLRASSPAPAIEALLAGMEHDATVYPKIQQLGSTSNVQELETLAGLTPEEEKERAALEEQATLLRSPEAKARLQLAEGQVTRFGAFLGLAKAASAFDWAQYGAALQSVGDAGDRYRAANEGVFGKSEIPGVLQPTWQAFVHAAEPYLQEYFNSTYPLKGERCIYCRQELTDAAVALIQSYRDFCTNATKQALDRARSELVKRIAPLLAIDVEKVAIALGQYKPLDEASEQPVSTMVTAAVRAVDALRTLQTEVREHKALDVTATMKQLADSETQITSELKRTEELLKTLRKDAGEQAATLTKVLARLGELRNRALLKSRITAVRQFVERARWTIFANVASQAFMPLLRSLTEQSKQASEQLLNKDFKQLFTAECGHLSAPAVNIVFPGKKGQAARKKTIEAVQRLSDVLSEGEQKVIALADFLAEASLGGSVSPIVFDDPVNSLDYRRLEVVASRIVLASRSRQTIVFTHNILFALSLLAHFEKDEAGVTYYQITADDGKTGLIATGRGPRADSVSSTTKEMTKLLEAAKTTSGEVRRAVIERGYGLIRNWCEVVLEQEILAGAIRRYEPNVRMTVLDQISPERLIVAKDVIAPLFEKACRLIVAHSQPLETLNVVPTLDELRADWKTLTDARSGYMKNK